MSKPLTGKIRQVRKTHIGDTSKLPMIKNYELTKLVRDHILAGQSREDTKKEIQARFKITDPDRLNVLYKDGLEYYQRKALAQVDKDTVITDHLLRYEEIYNFFHDLDIKDLKLIPLQAKERLLGYHNNVDILEITQENNVEVVENTRYNLAKLSDTEKKRLGELLQKVSKK